MKELRKIIREVFETEDNNVLTPNYMLGKPTYAWLKQRIKEIIKIEPKDKTRIQILQERKKDLNLSEFQQLFNHWNFCNKFSGQFNIGNNPVENYKHWIEDWCWYLVMLQLFPKELKAGQETFKRSFYTNPYNEILQLPKLSGELEKDKVIFEGAVRNFYLKPDSSTRQLINIYDTYRKSLGELF